MSTTILGISSFYHDSAAALVRDGEIVAAAQEERFSRKKHDPRFPRHAINYCLEEAFIEADELDAIVFYDNPLLTWDRVVKNCVMAGEPAFEQFEKAAASILGIKLWVQDYARRTLGCLGRSGRVLFTDHHFAHAASAFYPSPFREAAILTLDGVGEWDTTAIGRGDDDGIELAQVIEYPHSLGLLYSAFTYFCGFKVNSGEYKLMGLAPYGRPVYERIIRDNLIDLKDDGSFRLNMEYFGYLDSFRMTNERFDALFGGPPRQPESRITRREMDLAMSVQAVLEDAVLRLARHARRESGAPNLVMAGGVALNCVANGKLLREGIFDHIWIQPASGDAGGALGAALMAAHGYFGSPRRMSPGGRDTLKGSYLGPAYSSAEVRAFLERHGYPYERIEDPDGRARTVAQALADGKVTGFLSGRMEFGPRALGARSIIGDPRSETMQSTMNLKIKYRESFRPFAPSCLAENAAEYFDLDVESPYMLLVAPVREERCIPFDREAFYNNEDMLQIINQARSDLPAITHVDFSARVQTVHPEDHPDYYRLIRAFREITGFGVIINTSFNVRGEPIVCSPADAYRCFMRTEMDLLVLEDCLLWKSNQPAFAEAGDWRKDYELD
ncbi:MAG TPA: carbamoyltransferase [Spirochaetota bacterium]|nr:carbamoyltransferase [Spirochaetota bacterium]HNT11722.1 carbamoyltransferase [Spirochaetota bacterium]